MAMSNNTSEKLIQERAKLLAELASFASLLRGSWVERFSTCSRPNCECHKGKRHGPRHYLVINEKGRQRQRYIPNACVEDAQAGLRQYKRLQEIVQRITSINLSLMKEANRECH
jgi:hypothetical protein